MRSDESFWSLEERKTIKILLSKASIDAASCWSSLFSDGRFSADLWTADEMQKKLTLQRLQAEVTKMMLQYFRLEILETRLFQFNTFLSKF